MADPRAINDRRLNPPEDIEHAIDCPLHYDKPWRPARCICREIGESYLDDRADARRKGE